MVAYNERSNIFTLKQVLNPSLGKDLKSFNVFLWKKKKKSIFIYSTLTDLFYWTLRIFRYETNLNLCSLLGNISILSTKPLQCNFKISLASHLCLTFLCAWSVRYSHVSESMLLIVTTTILPAILEILEWKRDQQVEQGMESVLHEANIDQPLGIILAEVWFSLFLSIFITVLSGIP